jgi:outer membrane receptor protein involved in Fe transport
MTKLSRAEAGRVRTLLPAILLASTSLAGAPAFAQIHGGPAPPPPPPGGDNTTSAGPAPTGELVVTAQKREENVQKVPLSIQVLSSTKLDQLSVKDASDFIKFLPSVSTQSLGPGYVNVYMRGVASGENSNHSGPLPSVGTYLDEAPITTIGGTLDVHIYDIARVESLAGPQGTLYGASSESGTVRIITNKPRLGQFEASYQLEGNHVEHGDFGYSGEGMANLPLGDKAAIRLVGWAEHDAGYIDNVHGTRTYPSSGITIDNAAMAKNDYNDVNLYGGRAALRIDLNESWTVTPSVMFQDETSHGVFGYDRTVGDLQVKHFFKERTRDQWVQAAATIEGSISNFDIVYAGSYMKRVIHSQSDYSDYSFFYDQAPFYYGSYIYDNGGNLIDPSQYIHGRDGFSKQSHELRISSPKDNRLRFIGGLFYERQTHNILQRYIINNLATVISVPGWPNTLWLTDQQRVDRDYAGFGELSFDITPQLTATGGVRVFKYDNSLVGFFGFGAGFSSHTGVSQCFAPAVVAGSPCTDLDKSVSETNFTHKLNLTYHIDDQKMVYATWSRGFRPGGINRRSSFGPYTSDFLTNYEVGWKTAWMDGRVRFNGALYLEEWKNFQFSFLGANGLTNIRNAPQAEIKGVEADISWRPDEHWTISGAGAFTDGKLTKNFCQTLVNGLPVTNCATPEAPSGTSLPVTPKFKGNATVRYEWRLGEIMAHLQGTVSGQSSSWADLRVIERGILGPNRGFATADFSAGLSKDSWNIDLSLLNATDTRADISRYAECATQVCGSEAYIVTNRPRTVAIRFGQRF